MEAAIRAINEGEIFRFLTKPCNEVDLAMTILQALQLKDLKAISQRLLEKNQRQSAILQELEKEYPGITKVKRTSAGDIILEEQTDNEIEKLINKI